MIMMLVASILKAIFFSRIPGPNEVDEVRDSMAVTYADEE